MITNGLKASSLFYAIVISVIIAIVSSSFILFAYISHIDFETFQMNKRIHLNARSGLNLLLSEQSLVEPGQTVNIDLYGTGDDSVTLSRKRWGIYEVHSSQARFKNNVANQMVLSGYLPDTNKLFSLYVSDNDKPIALCGNTKIKGTAYLPKAGVKRAYIEGQSYTGTEMIYGNIKESKSSAPKYNEQAVKNIQQLLAGVLNPEHDSIIAISKDLSGDSIQNSFANKTLVFTSSNPITISNGVYEGNIIIASARQIKVSATAQLKDVILLAPKIIFEKDVKGALQAFAGDSIIVNKNVSLHYPSVLGVLKDDDYSNTGAVVLTEKDTVMGLVFALKVNDDPLKQAMVSLQNDTYIYGTVYSNSFLQPQGEVRGNVIAEKIILSTPSSVYENHLLNARIDVSARSKHYVGANLFEESTQKQVVKCLH